jgi:hypothetical protein
MNHTKKLFSNNNEIYKENQLVYLWELNHELDLDPELTCLDFDISHQRGWKGQN